MSSASGFGAPSSPGARCFFVDIPADPAASVSICEDYGFDIAEEKRETIETRALLARDLWATIRDDARMDFNKRLKEHKQKAGTWKAGTVRLDRFLGRELCVLAWAVERATPEQCPVICQKWLALRPEERWWLFAKTAAEGGSADQSDRGWRKALRLALSDQRSAK